MNAYPPAPARLLCVCECTCRVSGAATQRRVMAAAENRIFCPSLRTRSPESRPTHFELRALRGSPFRLLVAAATREIRFRGTQRASSPPVRQASNWSRKSLSEARSDMVGRLRLTRLREICPPDRLLRCSASLSAVAVFHFYDPVPSSP